MSLQGQIEEMGLGPVIQTLSLNRYRGTLRIETEDAGSQFFFISAGEIVLVRQVARDPVRLGDLLIRAGKISEEELDEALEAQKGKDKRLGEVLVDLGLVEPPEIDQVIRGKFEEDFLDMFLLDKGRFEFIFGLTPESLFSPDEKLERVTLNTSSLMLEAMRRVDEWQDMIKSLGSLDTIFAGKVGELPHEELDALTALPHAAREQLFELLDGRTSLREVLALAIGDGIASRLETFLFMHHLGALELVEPLDAKSLLGHARSALTAKDVPMAAKFIRAILGRRGELETALLKRYLDFLQKNQRPRLAFDEARLFAAQCLARGDSAQAIALYEEAIELDFKNVEVLDRLFYALLRDNQRERAVEVGLMVREYLSADSDLPVAIRIVKNLKELDPDNPAVLELSGRVLLRREQLEQAASELSRALDLAPPGHPRRLFMIDALLELEPHRADLLAERETEDMRLAREAVQREFRSRLLLFGALPAIGLVAVMLVFVANSELTARGLIGAAERVLAEDQPSAEELSQAQYDLIRAQATAWLSGGEAERLLAQVEGRLAVENRGREESAEQKIKEQQEQREERARRDAERRREGELQQALENWKRLRAAGDYGGATEEAARLRQRYPDDERFQDLPGFLLIRAEPAGVEVFLGSQRMGQTAAGEPLVIVVRPGEQRQLRFRLRGYRALDRALPAELGGELVVTLERGPTWTFDAESQPLLPVVTGDGAAGQVVVAERAGRVSLLEGRLGEARWSQPDVRTLGLSDRAAQAAARKSSVRWVVWDGTRVLVACGARLVALERGGQLAWQLPLSQEVPAQETPPAAWSERSQRLILPWGKKLLLVDTVQGRLVGDVQRLPAPAAARPAVGGERAYVLLADQSLVGYGCDGSGQAWRLADLGEGLGAPVFEEETQCVLLPQGKRLQVIAARGKKLTPLDPDVGQLLGVAVSRNRVLALSRSGFLTALRAASGQVEFSNVNRAPLERGALAGPLLHAGEIFAVDGLERLVRYTDTGRLRRVQVELEQAPGVPLVGLGQGVLVAQGQRIELIEPGEE